ncbi:MAG TPA: Mur ligase domain-containing protein, partial [Pseudolysinimonas sp.]
MITLSIAELAKALGATVLLPDGTGDDTTVSGSVETDSRQVSAGSVFFALPGEQTDGHLFAPAAVEAGAALVVAEHAVEVGVPQLIVPDGVAALAAMARLVVGRVRSAGKLRMVAITGSNGKTTT